MTEHAAAGAGLEAIIGRVLRTGVAAATACLVLGLALAAAWPEAGSWCLQAGLVILMATPAMRVVASIVEYAFERDWTFVALSTIVLMELVAGAIAAAVFHTRL